MLNGVIMEVKPMDMYHLGMWDGSVRFAASRSPRSIQPQPLATGGKLIQRCWTCSIPSAERLSKVPDWFSGFPDPYVWCWKKSGVKPMVSQHHSTTGCPKRTRWCKNCCSKWCCGWQMMRTDLISSGSVKQTLPRPKDMLFFARMYHDIMSLWYRDVFTLPMGNPPFGEYIDWNIFSYFRGGFSKSKLWEYSCWIPTIDLWRLWIDGGVLWCIII